MDSTWFEAPWPAVLVRGAPGALHATPNSAVARAATDWGLSVQSLLERAVAAVAARSAQASLAAAPPPADGPVTVCVVVADGTLVWLTASTPPLALHSPSSSSSAPGAVTPSAEPAQQTALQTSLQTSLKAARDSISYLDRALVMAGVSVWRVDLVQQRVHLNAVGFHEKGIDQDPQGIDLELHRSTIHRDDLSHVLAASQEAMASDRVVECMVRYRRPDGRWMSALTRRVVERDAQGLAIGLSGVSLDLTELHLQRELTRSLQERTATVAEALGAGFWRRDVTTGLVEWDEQMHRIYGIEPSLTPKQVGQWIDRFVHADDRAPLRAHLQRGDAEVWATMSFDFRIIDGSGRLRHIHSWSRRLTDGGRHLLAGVHIDITDQALDRQRTQRELQRAQFVVQSSGLGVWERDLRGHVNHWSAGMYRLRGCQPDDPRSPDEIFLQTIHPDDSPAVLALLNEHLQHGKGFTAEYRVKAGPASAPDLPWRWLHSEGVLIRDADGQVTGAAGFNIDITERRRAAELQEEKRRLEQAHKDKLAFMAGMSHELRTPLNAVLGFARLLASDEQAPLNPQQQGRVQRIETAGQHLLRMIDELLDIAQRPSLPLPAAPAGQLHVLCVEDNPVNLQLVRELLALRPGVRLRCAEDGLSGVAAALAEPPDLVLLDLQLPDISGQEVFQRLKADPRTALCHIVALSADAMPEHISAVLSAGFDGYWTKPIEFDAFLGHIDRLAQTLRQH